MYSKNELYASLPRRIKASAVDSVVVLSLFILLPVSIKSLFPNDSIVAAILMYLPLLLFEPILISYFGATIGQYLFGIEVSKSSSYSKCPFHLSLLRYYAKIFLGGISLVYMLFSKKRQAIHDHMAGTIVILSKKRLKNNPEFANQGELEQEIAADGEFVYPSAIGRFLIFILWYIVASVVIGIFVEISCFTILPDYTLENERFPQSVEIVHNILLSITFFLLAVLAAKGYLFGARKKRISEL